MKFETYKRLNIDTAGVHCIGIFKVISDDMNNGKFISIYFTDEMKLSMVGVEEGNIIDENHIMHYILSRYPKLKPNKLWDTPEDALIEVFRQLYKDNDNFKKEREENGC